MAAQPQDRLVDRRSFLARSAALAAVPLVGATALPKIAFAGPSVSQALPANDPNATSSPRPEALADITELTIAEAAFLIRAGRLSPQTLIEAYLDRIIAFEPAYQAFNLVLAGEAIDAAGALGRNRGPLHGIPLAIKDNYYTAGVTTTANSYLFETFVPPFDATCVARLKAAGGIVLGKTQMGPLATTRATTPNGVITTRNAWTPENSATNPGGSSSGSATSVAGRLASSSIGTQTGGSITAPANAQNLTGLKPTMGRASLYGIIPLSYTRDHPGPLARDVKDAAIMLQAMGGPDANDFRTLGLPPMPDLVAAATPVRRGNRVVARWTTRIGVTPDYLTGGSAAARQAFLDTLASVPGISIVQVPLPDEWSVLTGGAFNNVRLPERSEPFRQYMRGDLKGFGVSVTGWLQGAMLGADEFVTGQRAKTLLLQRVFDTVLSQCDVVVQTGPVPFDIIGLPELALPIGFSSTGLPVGTILGAGPFGEERLLAVGAAYQALTDWHLRRPPNPAQPSPGPAATSVDAVPGRRGRGSLPPRMGAAAADAARGRMSAEEAAATSE
jgi:Asp-tRNA(Asn)/Glu-tRNA(Gln) amidotransferase A subunit family amidase